MDKIQIVYRYIILYYMHKRSRRRLFMYAITFINNDYYEY